MVQIRFIKDTEGGYKEGDIVKLSEKDAEEIIKTGYAEKHDTEQKEKIKKGSEEDYKRITIKLDNLLSGNLPNEEEYKRLTNEDIEKNPNEIFVITSEPELCTYNNQKYLKILGLWGKLPKKFNCHDLNTKIIKKKLGDCVSDWVSYGLRFKIRDFKGEPTKVISEILTSEEIEKIKANKEAVKYLTERADLNKSQEQKDDLKTFTLNEEEIIKTKVFTSHLLNENIFGFGLLLPRNEDIIDKKGKVLGQQQRWRAVIITSEHRGLVVSQWFQKEYKINYEEVPYEMRLRWGLKDIDDFLHNPKQIKINGKDLFESIKKQYKYYLYFRSPEWYDIHTLWDIGTYLHQLFSAYPLFENRGLSGTAKTKTMLVSSYITLNSTDIMTNPSEATLFRETELLRPTKYIDEAEKLFKFTKEGMEADNRVELINASYTRNGSVPRQEKIGNQYTTKWYHVYSPTQISSINGLYGATESRAITQIHTKAPDNDKRGEKDPEDDIDNGIWKIIKNNCYRWTLENWKIVYEAYLNFDIETKLKKRDLQIWKSLLVLAKVIDEKELLPKIISFAEKLSTQRKNDNISGTLDHKYLTCLNKLIINSKSDNKIYVDDIREKYNLLFGTNEPSKSNKSISIHLDKLGFKELRDKDYKGAFYIISKETFDEIVTPLTNDFVPKEPEPEPKEDNSAKNEEKSSDSSDSSDLCVNNNKILMNDDEHLSKYDDLSNLNINNNKIKIIKPDESDEFDENDESLEQRGIKNGVLDSSFDNLLKNSEEYKVSKSKLKKGYYKGGIWIEE